MTMTKGYTSQTEYLHQVLELVRLRLSDDGQSSTLARQIRQRCEATVDAGDAVALDYLFWVFGLTEFEQHCVQLSLAAELDDRYCSWYADRQGGESLPTLGLCLRSFTGKQEQQMELAGHWRQRRSLLSYFFVGGLWPGDDHADLRKGLKLHRRIVDFALDYTAEDSELKESGGLLWPEEKRVPMAVHQDLLDRMETYARSISGEKLLFCLSGARGSGRRTLLYQYCEDCGRPLVWLDLPELLNRKGSWEALLQPYLREVLLRHAVLAVIGADCIQKQNGPDSGRAHLRWLLEETARMTDRLFLLSEENWPPDTHWGSWQRMELHLELPDTNGRLALWQHCTAGYVLEPDVSLDSLANKFSLLPGQIDGAARKAEQLRRWQGKPSISTDLLHQGCRDQLPSSIGSMASRVNADYSWEDLILPETQKQKLKEACNQVEYRKKVYEDWGFGRKVVYGRGVSMLFSGPPGTGKTMAAQVIASRLRLELYKVDLSGVISKYVGETEKQLGAVFDEVKKSQSILFFDEADALFGKRSEVKDAHDRYANVQTAYLLQKIEEYDGIVILASNLLQNFDEAFKRRIKFIIDFTLPDRERREQIWKSVLPSALPVSEELDIDFLARSFELSGSSIKNIAIAAAFLAADEGVPLNMAHLLLSVQAEQHKAGKTTSREDFGEYYRLVRP